MKPLVFALILILSSSLVAAPAWVPADKAASFDRIILDAGRYADILEAGYYLTDCKVSGKDITIIGERGTLNFEIVMHSNSDVACEVKDGLVYLSDEPTGINYIGYIITGAAGVVVGIVIGILI